MLKVVIADDEPRVCRLVQMLADWNALGMEVIGTASNGFEALEMMEKLMPDILITDIRMPGCDGLELIKKAKVISPNLEIALISGYAQFEYAQTAMQYDVGGYLLKPIKKDVLMDILEKLGRKCRERATSATIMEDLRKDSNKSRDLLRNRLFEDLLNKKLYAPSKEQLQSEYDFHVQDGLLQVFILKMDYNLDNFCGASLSVIQKKVEESFNSSVFSLCLTSEFQFYGSSGYGMLNYDTKKSDQIRRVLRQCLNLLVAQKFIFGPIEFSLAVSKIADIPEKLPILMFEAQNAITERIVEGTGRLLETVLPASGINSRKLLDKYNRTMDHIVDILSIEEADKAISSLNSEVKEIAGVRGFEIFDLILAAGKMFAIRLNVKEDSGFLREFEEHCRLCSSVDNLFDCLQDFQRKQINILLEQRESESIRPIRIAKQYIHQHFNKAITLEDVCAATGFSVSYFSTMFKKECGEGFSKYLIRVRIEHAKALLQETNLSVMEICDQVGYSDLKHFTSTFKKMTGLNPAQYRKLYG